MNGFNYVALYLAVVSPHYTDGTLRNVLGAWGGLFVVICS